MADISQVNMEEMIRKYSKEEVVRRMENIVTMLKLQKQVLELQVAENEEKRRQEDKRRKYKERWEKKEQRR